MNDDFLLDEDDENLEDEGYITPEIENENEDSSQEDISSDDKADTSLYEGKLTQDEIYLLHAYDDVSKSEDDLEYAVTTIVMSNPQHTSSNTVSMIIKDLFHKQGHSRMQAIRFNPAGLLRGEEIDAQIEEDDDNSFNDIYAREARELINRFIGYLSERDLSKDSVVMRRRKQRQIPALIIFLFSSGLYDLIIDCPNMPTVYQEQIQNAFRKINQAKYDILNELIKEYEKAGRIKVAERVKDLGLSWFNKEPAEIRFAAEYRDLGLTSEDVSIYRKYRGKYTNTSSAITKDVISDLIEVAVDPEKGIYEKLKDKTRTEAINDVKRVLKDFTDNENPQNSELASRIIFKEL